MGTGGTTLENTIKYFASNSRRTLMSTSSQWHISCLPLSLRKCSLSHLNPFPHSSRCQKTKGTELQPNSASGPLLPPLSTPSAKPPISTPPTAFALQYNACEKHALYPPPRHPKLRMVELRVRSQKARLIASPSTKN